MRLVVTLEGPTHLCWSASATLARFSASRCFRARPTSWRASALVWPMISTIRSYG